MSPARPDTSKQALAAEVWQLMADFCTANFRRSAQARLMDEIGLTPAHFRALSILDPDEPKPMRAMATTLCCDASMATWLVDRLEERGLAERRTPPGDRRVKTVVLTPLGIKTRDRLRQSFYDPPSALLSLDATSLELLRNELRKLPAPPGHDGRGC
jgi:DNA-binding MarR family transcriptional regulator